MKKMLFRYCLVPTLVLGFLVSLILPALTVNALMSVNSTTPDSDRTKSYAYYKAMEQCLVLDEMNHDIGTTDAQTPKNWRNWINNASVSADYIIYPSGSSDCNAIFPDALSFWGYNSETFLQDMGYKLSADGKTYSVSGVKLSQQFTNLIQSKVYGGKSITADPTVKYNLLWSAYTSAQACNAQQVGPLSSQPPSITALAQNNTQGDDGYWYEVVKPYTGASAPVATVYKTNKSGSSVNQRSNTNQNTIYVSTQSSNLDCQKSIVSAINSASAAAYTVAITTAITQVKSQYGSAIKTLADKQCKSNSSCVSGWTNDFNSCFDSYINSSSFSYPTFQTSAIATCMTKNHPGQFDAIKAALDTVDTSSVTTTTSTDPCIADPTAKSCNKTSCAVDGIGWIVCPVMSFFGTIADQAFGFLASSFLEVKADMLNTDPTAKDSNGNAVPTSAFSAWQIMRNFANIMFVIAFMVIIFSQITSFGMANYSVKKMLPRLIVAAILVNLSFYICQIAVDISNILGYSLKGLFDTIGKYTKTPGVGDASGNGFGMGIGIIALLAGGITLAFAISLPVLGAVVIALFMIVLILLAREALIVLLVVISPLAFVAYLLPNTEQWYKKWQKTLVSLLMVFPIIAVVFGASSLAAGIIKASSNDPLVQLLAMGVAVVPLFAVPSLLKGSMNAAGSIGAKMSSLSSKANGRIKGKVSNTSRAGQFAKDYANQRNRRRALTQAGVSSRRGGAKNPLNWMAMGNKAINNSRLSGGFGNRSAAAGVALATKMEDEEVSNERLTVGNMQKAELQKVLTDKGVPAARKAAALDRLITIGNPEEYEQHINDYGKDKSEGNAVIRRTMTNALAEKGPKFLKASDLDVIRTGNLDSYQDKDSAGNITLKHTLAEIAAKNADDGVYSQQNMVADNAGNLQYAYFHAATRGKGGRMKQTAYDLKHNDNLNGNIKQNARQIDDIDSGTWTPPPPPTPPSP